VAKQALAKGLKMKTSSLWVTPGSDQVATRSSATASWPMLRRGRRHGAANACGPCIGQWKRDDIKDGEVNSDRHELQPELPEAQRRQPGTNAFIGSPEIVTAPRALGRR
jgi:aconitate hydratase